MKRSLRVRESVSHYERKISEPDLLTGDGERHQAARFLSVVVRDVSLERRLTSLSVSFLRHCQALKTPPLKSTMHGDDWIVQTDLLAIDVGHVVRVCRFIKLLPKKLIRYSHS